MSSQAIPGYILLSAKRELNRFNPQNQSYWRTIVPILINEERG